MLTSYNVYLLFKINSIMLVCCLCLIINLRVYVIWVWIDNVLNKSFAYKLINIKKSILNYT